MAKSGTRSVFSVRLGVILAGLLSAGLQGRVDSAWGQSVSRASQATVTSEATSWRIIDPDVIYGRRSGLALTYDVIRPRQDANGAAAIFVMSGGWVSVYRPPGEMVRLEFGEPNVYERVVKAGYTLFIVRHRSSPVFQVPDATADLRLAVQHIHDHAATWGIDPERIGVFGGSAGGHLALLMGIHRRRVARVDAEVPAPDATPDEAKVTAEAVAGATEAESPVVADLIRCVVAFFPPTDLRPYVTDASPISEPIPALAFPREALPDYCPLLLASGADVPTLLIHGDQDELVPVEQSRLLKTRWDEVGGTCELLVLAGAGHGFEGADQTRAGDALLNWLHRYLVVAQSHSE